MKLLYPSVTLLSTVAFFQSLAHAAPLADAAVYYVGFTKPYMDDHRICEPFGTNDLLVDYIVYSVDVTCFTYFNDDCSGKPNNATPFKFKKNFQVKTVNLGNLSTLGAIKCA
ncbi:hypothetical protein BCR42DRAFT_421106 [Absidia repens]|uniref:Uncharacterized protein n=1 Tax=Absidia repens TaxID=90262 RepID=A0A1X2I7Y9_9FUNG|nr:hypothetical protein BCR42DRAFT_421106 [Absidia repens]